MSPLSSPRYGLADDAATKRAMAELKSEMNEDLNKVKKVFKSAESLHEKFSEAARLKSAMRKGGGGAKNGRKQFRMSAVVDQQNFPGGLPSYSNNNKQDNNNDDNDDDSEEAEEAVKPVEKRKSLTKSHHQNPSDNMEGDILNFVRSGFGTQLHKGAIDESKLQLSADEIRQQKQNEREAEEAAEKKRKELEVKDSSARFFVRQNISDQVIGLAQQATIRGNVEH